MSDAIYQRCINPACGGTRDLADTSFTCPTCAGLVDVAYDWSRLSPPRSLREFEAKWSQRTNPLSFSGVWRFRELLPFAQFAPPEQIMTIGEGQTILQKADAVARYVGMNAGRLFLQYEGMNPSGSFKDNGMTAAFTHARLAGARRAACASTGNTSASLAVFCSATGLMRAIIFIGSGKIAYGKLAQGLDHGALTIQIAGDFDDAMLRVQQVARQLGVYLVNSINPFRLEGQKTIMYRVLEALGWEPPDWIVVPGGNLGNVSAFGKAFAELLELGLIQRAPRLAVINALGADTLYQLYERFGLRWQPLALPREKGGPGEVADSNGSTPPNLPFARGGGELIARGGEEMFARGGGEIIARGGGESYDANLVARYYAGLDAEKMRAATIASAIEINRPVNLPKALRALAQFNGVVREVTDQEIMDAKAKVGAGGLGCEPASAASVAGARKLCQEGTIGQDERVVCILTGHQLKDPTATVAYHSTDQKTFDEVLGHRGVRRAAFANRAVQVANDLNEIMRAIELYA
jgi:threonine synthase